MRTYTVIGRSFGQAEIAAEDILGAIVRAQDTYKCPIGDIRFVEEIQSEQKGPRLGQEMWAVGVEHQPGSFGMLAGPYPTEKQALEFTPSSAEQYAGPVRLLRFLSNAPREGPTHEISHNWDGSTWVKEK